MKQFKSWFLFFGLMGLTGAYRAHAQPESSTRADEVSTAGIEPATWSLFGGVASGMGRVSGQDYQSAPSGGLLQLSALASHEMRDWTIDGGMGWIYSSVSGRNQANQEIRIRTRAATAEVSPRYHLTDRWQLGPVAQLVFGADTGFGPSVGNAIGTALFGARAVYELSIERFPVRFLGQAVTDLAIPDRRVTLVSAGVQIGIPLRRSSSGAREPVALKRQEDEIQVSQAAPRAEPIRLVLDPQRVFFGTNSSRLRPEVERVLAEIGEYLTRNPQGWSKVEIAGHADQRGSYSHNLKLSRHRAAAVRNSFCGSGPCRDEISERIRSEGYSFSKPVDPANHSAAWAKNRRVEVVFRDVQDPAPLLKIIEELSQ